MGIFFQKLRVEVQILVIFLSTVLFMTGYDLIELFFDDWLSPRRSGIVTILLLSFIAAIVFLFARKRILRLTDALQENENRLGFLVESCPLTIYTSAATPPYRTTYVSKNILQQLGCTVEQFMEIENFWQDHIHPDDRQQIVGDLTKVFEHDEYRQEYRFQRPDGSYCWLLDNYRVIRNETGDPVEMIGYLVDITTLKQLDDQVRLQALVLDQIQDHVSITDLNGILTYINQSEARKYRNHEIKIGQHVTDYGDDSLSDANQEEIIQATLELGSWRGNVVNYDKDDIFSLSDLRTTLVKDAKGKPIAMVGIGTDITERKQAESELIKAKELAEEANHAKSEFLSRMSHELRTPLNAIIGFTQIIQMDDPDESIGLHSDNLKRIINSGWHLTRIIEDLLNLSAIEADKVVLDIEDVDVCKSINDLIELMSPLANERNIELSYLVDNCGGILVRADRFRLKQVMINLIANAIKYNREGGKVTISCQNSTDYIRLLVTDTGEGIQKTDLASLFQPFSRLSNQAFNIEGAGIGLSIAKQLTELMGGKIGVESVFGVGSTFWVELPVVETQESVIEEGQ